MFKPDPIDQGLLNLLRANARTSVVELAKKLGVSRATVQNRIRRLEANEIILGYTLLLGSKTQKQEVRAMMCISVESAYEAGVIAELRGNPNIAAIHHTTGQWDLIVEIQAESLSMLNKIVGAIRLIEGVGATETNLLLDTYE